MYMQSAGREASREGEEAIDGKGAKGVTTKYN